LTFDMAALRQLDFQQPDFDRFPCLRLAYEAAAASQNHCIALNAADEIAVDAFLAGNLPFTGIPRTIEQVLALTPTGSPASIPEVLAADLRARSLARESIHAAVVS
jgi:1-deoxy-D-xylulose-5-phosphate reductoisomerase